MSDQTSWPGGPYGIQPQPAPSPYQNQAVPPPPPAGVAQPAGYGSAQPAGFGAAQPAGFGPVQPINWGSTAPKPSFLDALLGEKNTLWRTAVRISAGVVAIFAFIFGIVMYSNVSRWTANLNGGLFTTGQPNTGLAVCIMFGIWIMGFVAACLIMLATDVAADVRHMRTSTDQQH